MPRMKLSVPLLCLISLSWEAPPVGAQAAPAGGPIVTRLVQLFTRLETEWMDAARRKDRAALEGFLADDYELRSAARPGQPIPRADWLQGALSRENLHSFAIGQMAVRELGDVALVSFVYHREIDLGGKDRTADLFVVDAWVQKDGVWKVKARYASPMEGRPSAGSGTSEGGQKPR
jgi:ketosteroid isomerase-like protein